mmetsp:Transcript_7814/g.34801  ORF Transcript_7814/g.34801 Transcript_7814/m.34801 type:complete len:111 (-) Transcript_7814:2079-2411(-)
MRPYSMLPAKPGSLSTFPTSFKQSTRPSEERQVITEKKKLNTDPAYGRNPLFARRESNDFREQNPPSGQDVERQSCNPNKSVAIIEAPNMLKRTRSVSGEFTDPMHPIPC